MPLRQTIRKTCRLLAGAVVATSTAGVATAQPCVEGEDTLCLQQNRFEITVTWDDGQGQLGSGQVVPTLSSDSGIFYFFEAGNWELLVKVLNACPLNGKYWVYAAATTDRQYQLVVRDTEDGALRTYRNPLGNRSPAFADTSAFSCGSSGRTETARSSSLDASGGPVVDPSAFALQRPAMATVHTVGPGASFATIQDAIDASVAGGDHELRLRSGTFVEGVTIELEANTKLTISGGWDSTFTVQATDARATILDGGGTDRPLDLSLLDAEVHIENLRITNGWAVDEGGGMRAQLRGSAVLEMNRVVVDHNLLTGSNSNTGGGLAVRALDDSRFDLLDAIVSDNTVGSEPNSPAGGGLGLIATDRAVVRIVGNQFDGNRLVDEGQNTGSGVYADAFGESEIEFSDNVVRLNTCTGNVCVGATTLWASESSRIEARRNVIISNLAPAAVDGSQANLIGADNTTLLFTDNLVADGFAGGIVAWSTDSGRVVVLNSTITMHPGTLLTTKVFDASSGDLTVANTILGSGPDAQLDPATVLDHNLIDTDPRFVDAPGGDFRLRADSPARDAGSNHPDLGATDLDGRQRVLGGKVDLGAYEFEEGSTTRCARDGETHCLLGSRFEVTVRWQDFQGGSGPGAPVPTARLLSPSGDSGLFYFFDEDNWEMLVKIIDACDFNQRFWVYGAATTNVGYELQVRDTASGDVVRYSNPLGERSPAITDTQAFATCP